MTDSRTRGRLGLKDRAAACKLKSWGQMAEGRLESTRSVTFTPIDCHPWQREERSGLGSRKVPPEGTPTRGPLAKK